MDENKLSRKYIILYSLPMILIWILYLIAYYPGVMSVDSINQWGQIKEGVLWDGHPVVHTLFIKLIISIWNSPAAVALSQIIITALVLGFGLYSLENLGISKKFILATNAFFAVFPTFGFMSIILWKDILFSAFLVLFSILVINIVATQGRYLEYKKNKIIIIVVSIIICLFRHNGLLSFLGAIFLIMIFYRRFIKSTISIFVITMGVYFLVKGPIYSMLNVEPTTSNETLAIPTQQIAAVIKGEGKLTESEEAYLDKILPLELWKENYNVRTVDTIKMHKDFNRDLITDDMGTFLKTWIAIVKENPRIAIKAYAEQTSLIWKVKSVSNLANMKITDNDFSLRNITVSSTITDIFKSLYRFITEGRLRHIFWSPALFMYFIILFVIIAVVRNGFSSIIVITPVFLNIATYLLAIPAPDFRYLYSNLLIAPFIILFSFVNYKKEKQSIN